MTTHHYIAPKVYTSLDLQGVEDNLEGITPDLEVNMTDVGAGNNPIGELTIVRG